MYKKPKISTSATRDSIAKQLSLIEDTGDIRTINAAYKLINDRLTSGISKDKIVIKGTPTPQLPNMDVISGDQFVDKINNARSFNKINRSVDMTPPNVDLPPVAPLPVQLPGNRMASVNIDDWRKSIADKIALTKLNKNVGTASKFGKKLPGIGTLIGGLSLASSEDASAAIPFLSEADDLGPSAQSPEGMFERGQMNQSQFLQMMKQTQPDQLDEEQQNKFNMLKSILGKGRNPAVLPGTEYKE